MNKEQTIGWSLAVIAVALGYANWGWPGVVLAFTLMAFWLILQFSRALRTMREAAAAPMGRVASAVMVHAKLQEGMRLSQMLRLTRSLGSKLADDPETFEWVDASGARLRAEMRAGRLSRWDLLRPDQSAAPGRPDEEAPAP